MSVLSPPDWHAPDALLQLLSHRPPAILLDAIVDLGVERACAQVSVGSGKPYFCSIRRGIPAWVGIEFMAQTISLWSGYQQLSRGKPVRIGLLIGCREYHCNNAYFAEHDVLQIVAEPCYIDPTGLSSFQCSIHRLPGRSVASAGAMDRNSAERVASARINAMEPEHPYALLPQSR